MPGGLLFITVVVPVVVSMGVAVVRGFLFLAVGVALGLFRFRTVWVSVTAVPVIGMSGDVIALGRGGVLELVVSLDHDRVAGSKAVFNGNVTAVAFAKHDRSFQELTGAIGRLNEDEVVTRRSEKGRSRNGRMGVGGSDQQIDGDSLAEEWSDALGTIGFEPDRSVPGDRINVNTDVVCRRRPARVGIRSRENHGPGFMIDTIEVTFVNLCPDAVILRGRYRDDTLVGVDALAGSTTDVLGAEPIVEPVSLKRNVLTTATDLAVQLIRIDERLHATDLGDEEEEDVADPEAA